MKIIVIRSSSKNLLVCCGLAMVGSTVSLQLFMTSIKPYTIMGRKSKRDEQQEEPSTTATVVVVHPITPRSNDAPYWQSKINQLVQHLAATSSPSDGIFGVERQEEELQGLLRDEELEWQILTTKLRESSEQLRDALDLQIAEEMQKVQECSQRLYNQQLQVNKLKAEYQALMDYSSVECDSKLSQLHQQLCLHEGRILEESMSAQKLLEEQRQDIPRLQHQISLYASCTGIKWWDECDSARTDDTDRLNDNDVVMVGQVVSCRNGVFLVFHCLLTFHSLFC